MKPLILSALDTRGGAARAAYRLHHGLRAAGVPSRMLVQTKLSDEKEISAPPGRVNKLVGLARPRLDTALAKLLAGGVRSDYYPALLPFSPIRKQIRQLDPDVLNLHWVCGGMLRIEEFRELPQPMVWTLHDMWPFTGGCNYSADCERYSKTCGKCPQLSRPGHRDLSYRVLERKRKALGALDLTLVSPSQWLASLAAKSSLFRDLPIEVIPYGIDLNVYEPVPREQARALWNLPQDVPLALFGAVSPTGDRRKGFSLLQESLHALARSGEAPDLQLVIFGASEPENPPDLGFSQHYMGTVSDDLSLKLLYSAADLTVVPSREDNLPNVAIESIACGTPVAGFDVGGMREIVEHLDCGYMAPPENPEELASGMAWVLQHRHDPLLRQRARARAESLFGLDRSATRYRELFEALLQRRAKKAVKPISAGDK